jgi:hypothetical protein
MLPLSSMRRYPKAAASRTLLSVNGPQFTIIDGLGDTNPCVSLTDGASLTGFALNNGYGGVRGIPPLWATTQKRGNAPHSKRFAL